MHGWADMDGWMGGGFGGMWFGWLLIVAAIAGIAWLAVRGVGRAASALEILEQRYARGEIERDEYEQKRRDLQR